VQSPAPPQPSALRIENLRKAFGSTEVLKGLSLDLPLGRVVGLLGRNGAGKSTLIRCMLGLSPIDGGRIELLGADAAALPPEVLHRVGYVPQSFDLFPWMRVEQYLRFHRAFYPQWNQELVDRLVVEWELSRKPRIGELSHGQRQKLAIVRALAPEPDLLLLDEPVASLDPQTRRLFLDTLLREVVQPGKTVLFSTHITADLERANAHIMLLREGRIDDCGALAEFRARVRLVELDAAQPLSAPDALPGILRWRSRADGATLLSEGWDELALAALAAEMGASLRLPPATLEDLFVELG
jgi:ABC-2 type transport system ATP-binding protein